MKSIRTILALLVASVLASAPGALAQEPDPHHPSAATAPADTPREQPVAPPAASQQPGQMGGMMMNCPMMQSGQAGQESAMNCRMMQGHMQPGQTSPMQQAPGTTKQ